MKNGIKAVARMVKQLAEALDGVKDDEGSGAGADSAGADHSRIQGNVGEHEAEVPQREGGGDTDPGGRIRSVGSEDQEHSDAGDSHGEGEVRRGLRGVGCEAGREDEAGAG